MSIDEILDEILSYGIERADEPPTKETFAEDDIVKAEAKQEIEKAVMSIIGENADNVMNRMLQEEQRAKLTQWLGK